jgi:hypothetical protein
MAQRVLLHESLTAIHLRLFHRHVGTPLLADAGKPVAEFAVRSVRNAFVACLARLLLFGGESTDTPQTRSYRDPTIAHRSPA